MSTHSPILGGTAAASVLAMLLSGPAVLRGAQQPSQTTIQSLSEPGQGLAVLARDANSRLVTFATASDGRGILLAQAASAPADQRALSFVDDYGGSFGLARADTAVIGVHVDQFGEEHVRLQQLYRGVIVRGGEFLVHLRGSRVVAANGHVLAAWSGDVTPRVTAADAALTAQLLVTRLHPDAFAVAYSDPRVEVFSPSLFEPGAPPTALAWFIEASDGVAVREYIWVDAKTGTVILHVNQVPEALSRTVYDAKHVADTLPGTQVRSEGGAATGDTDADNAYTYAGITYNYYKNNHGRDSYDNAGAALLSSVHFCTNQTPYRCPSYANAFWNGSQMVYGDTYASADDVVGHELTHAVTERTAGLIYAGEPGALNESYSDIFGETIDLTDGVGTDTAAVRWKMGEDLPIGAIRDMMTPTAFHDPGKITDPDFKCDPPTKETDYGGVHTNSGVPNHAYALMVDGGSYNGETITGIGLTKAAKIEYRALTVYLTSGSGFDDNYKALNQACTDLIGTAGITASDCTQVKNATEAVEMNQSSCPTLALVVDDTGSMSEEIGGVRTSLTNTINRLKTDSAAASKPFPTVAIVTFKDDVTKRIVSNVPADLQTVVDSLYASGGDDCPESSNAALIYAAGLLVKHGVAQLFTDADSRPDGPDRAAVINAFRPNGLRLSVLLSGSCTDYFFGSRKTAFGAQAPRPSDNHDWSGSPSPRSSLAAGADVLGYESSTRTFSEIAAETGGFFTAIPDVKYSSDGLTRYTNVATNLSVSAVLPAVALLTPGTVPVGTSMRVEVDGSNTNFQPGSAAAVSGTGVTVVSATVISPTRLLVDLSVASSAATGFRDITVTTPLGAGVVETALGAGSLQITDAPFDAEVAGIYPTTIAQGKTEDIVVTGVGTHFAPGSTVDMGSGITVTSVSVASATSLTATVTADAGATIGFRDVTVSTGFEYAFEEMTGPLFVSAPPPVIPQVSSITPAVGKRGHLTSVTIVGQNTNFVDGTTAVALSGAGTTISAVRVSSPTTLTASISIDQAATLGFRDVTVTTGTEVAVLLNGFQIADPAAFPSSIVFGATKLGAGGDLVSVTAPQVVNVGYTGIKAGSAWTATANQPWVQISGASGSGAGQFTVSIVNPGNVIAGSTDLSATITVSVPADSVSDSVSVRLLVNMTPSSSAPPFGYVDMPSDGATGLVGSIPVTGWALDDVAVSRVELWRNCVAVVDAPLNACRPVYPGGPADSVYIGQATFVPGARPDVEQAFPQAPDKYQAGWGYLLLTNLLPDLVRNTPQGGQGTFTLSMYAIDAASQYTLLGTRTISLDNAHATVPFGAIDTPAQGATVPGVSPPFNNANQYPVFGWAMTQSPKCMTPASYQVYIDGVAAPLTAGVDWFTGLNRSDLPAAFPGLCDSNDALAVYYFNAAGLGMTSGVHTIAWSVVDNGGQSAVIGSRYFTLLTSSAERPPTGAGPATESDGSGLASLPPNAAAIGVRVGPDGQPFEPALPDAAGRVAVQVPSLGRVTLDFGGAVDRGYEVVGGDVRALPIGSTLDAAGGRFYWQPPVGFLGRFSLVFVRGTQRIDVDVTLFDPSATSDPVRMYVDSPGAGAAIASPASVAGWALDPHATAGTGIGAVHVWAQRVDALTSGPVFLGAATLGLERPDVARQYGAQFHAAGFQLAADLAPGVYDLYVYPWSDRAGDFEAAQVVRVTVR